MQKTIKISIDAPIIPAGSSFTHDSTSWQVSTTPDFTGDDLILDLLNDTSNLLDYRFNYDLNPHQPVYVRTKFHFSDNRETNWSMIVPLYGNQTGIKLSSTMLYTPIVTVNVNYSNNYKGVVTLKTNEMYLYSGVGIHDSTSWLVTDSDGRVYFKREKDKDNLRSIDIDSSILDKNKSYIVKAKHHSNTNADSNYGKTMLMLYNKATKLFELENPLPIVDNKRTYFRLVLFTPNFKSIDLRLLDASGTVITEQLNQTSKTPYIDTTGLIPAQSYYLQGKLTLTNVDIVTEWITKRSFILQHNELIWYKNDITYLEKQSFNQELMLGGETVQTSRELNTGTILLTEQHNDSVYNYRIVNNKLQRLDPAFVLDGINDLLAKPYINILPLYKNQVLVDYATDVSYNEYKHPMFKLYEYNNITNKFTFVYNTIRRNELYGTAPSNSLAVLKNNYVYYIPASETDIHHNDINLTLKRLDTNTMDITIEASLPFDALRNVALVASRGERLIVIGGTNLPTIDANNIEVNARTNNTVYEYTPSTGVWRVVCELPIALRNTVYNIQAFERRDGKIVLFNGSKSGIDLGNQTSYVLDIDTGDVVKNADDFEDTLRYRSSVLLMNGDILRISTRALDPQKVYRYISDTMAVGDVIDNTSIENILDLVVPVGETITIEDPYRYNSITIDGDAANNTGTLQWLNGDTVTTFKYNDLLVTRDMTICSNTEWNSITVLDGATLTVNDC